MSDPLEDYRKATERAGASAGPAPDEGDPKTYSSGLSGFIQSTLSAIPELVGADPSAAAEEFRNRNFWTGLVSSTLPALAGGIGSEALVEKIPALGRASEAILSRLGLGEEAALTHPVLRSAVKGGLVDQLPFELGRGLVGTATAPDDNKGDLWAGVATDLGLGTVAGGGLGWLMRSGGKAIERSGIGELLGGDPDIAPNFTLRAARKAKDAAEAAKVKDLGIAMAETEATPEVSNLFQNGSNAENFDYLRGAALAERPVLNQGVRKGWEDYVGPVEGLDTDAKNKVNQLFKPNDEKSALETGIDTRTWQEGGADNKQTLDIGQRDYLLKGTGASEIDDLVSSVRYPRVTAALDEKGARTLQQTLDKGGFMRFQSDGTWLGYNDDGAAVIAKRIAEGDPKAKGFGRNKIRPGDKFLMGLTDEAGRFVPTSKNFADRQVNAAFKMQRAFRPGVSNDVFAKADDALTEVSTGGLRDLRAGMKQDHWVQKEASNLWKRMGKEGPVGEQAQQIARSMYDVLAPTIAKIPKNDLYARLLAFATGRDALKSRLVSRMINGEQVGRSKFGHAIFNDVGLDGLPSISSIYKKLTPEETHMSVQASNAFIGPDKLKEFFPEGTVSDNLIKAMEDLRAVDKNFLDKYFLPTFKNSNKYDGKFDIHPDFTMASTIGGDFHQAIIGRDGKSQIYNVVGRSKAETEQQTAAILKKAAEEGHSWTAKPVELAALKSHDEHAAMFDRLQERLAEAQNKDVIPIVQRALKEYNAKQFSDEFRGPTAKGGGALSKRGVNKLAASTRKWTIDDALQAHATHRRDLLGFASDYGYRERFAGPMTALNTKDSVLGEDLNRKLKQFAGIEGRHTRFLNKTLSSVFGTSMGGKAASVIAQGTNKMMWAWNLGIMNPTASVVNLLTPLMNLPGMIARIHLMDERTFKNMLSVMPRYDEKGMIRGATANFDVMKVTLGAYRDMVNPPKELNEFLIRAQEEGGLGAGLTDNFIGGDSAVAHSMKDLYERKGILAAGWHGLTAMTRMTEDFSRGVSFAAGWRIAKSMGLEGEAAYRATLQMTDMAAYGYKQTQRSRIITGPVGSMFGLFKNFQIHYINDMLTYLKMGVKGEGWSPFLWQQASTMAIGGLGATPLSKLAMGVAAWHDNAPNSYAWMQKHWGNLGDNEDNHSPADAMYFGLAGSMGFSLLANLQQPGTDVAQDLQSFGNVVVVERGIQLGKAIGAGWQYAVDTGHNPMANDNIRDQFLNASMPRAAIRAMSVVEGNYIKTLNTGYPAMRDVSVGERVMYGMGITPVGVAAHSLEQQNAWRESESRRAATNSYGRLLADEMMNGDMDKVSKITDAMMLDNVDISSAYSSAMTIMNRDLYGDNLSRYDKQMLAQQSGRY